MGRYENILQTKAVADTARDPNTGDFIPGAESEDYVTVSDCRDEPNDSGKTLVGADGEAVKFGSIVYLPGDCPEIERATQIRVLDESGNTILEGQALRFKRYRQNCKLWV